MCDGDHSLQISQSPSDGQRREKRGQSLFFLRPPNLDGAPLTSSRLPPFMQSASSVFIHPFIDQHLVGRTVPIPVDKSGAPTVCWAWGIAQSPHSHGSHPVFSSHSRLPHWDLVFHPCSPWSDQSRERRGFGVRIPNQLLLWGTEKYVLLS